MIQEPKKEDNKEKDEKTPNDENGVMMSGHIKIFDPETGEVMVDKRNAIHYENMSQALANSLANKSTGFIHEMAFGNGGTSVDPTGVITYLTPNSTGTNSKLYAKTYYKVIDDKIIFIKETSNFSEIGNNLSHLRIVLSSAIKLLSGEVFTIIFPPDKPLPT